MTLSGAVRLRLKVRRCEAAGYIRRHLPHRPEAEGAIALSRYEFRLDVIALVGTLCHREHRSVPKIHAALRGRVRLPPCRRRWDIVLPREFSLEGAEG